MRYETVKTKKELDFRKESYRRDNYKTIWENENNIQLEKNNFNDWIFLILLFFFIIGGIIYWAITNNQKDTVIISIEGKQEIPLKKRN